MSYYGFAPYVPVAERRRQAEKALAKQRKAGHLVTPVVIEGRTIARSFWGKAWCENLENYSDYANRLPRGRTYVRNGSVLDLQIRPGLVQAQVSGSSIYRVEVRVAAVPGPRWQALCKDCGDRIESLVELLQGRFSQGVMTRLCCQARGCSPPLRRSPCPAVALTAPICASMWRRCSTASARAWTASRNCCSCSARWMARSSLPTPARGWPCLNRRLAGCWKGMI